MDFYPEIGLLAFFGLYAAVTDLTMLSVIAKYKKWIIAGLMVSVASSFLALSLYDFALTPLAMPHGYYHDAVQRFYRLIGSVVAFHR